MPKVLNLVEHKKKRNKSSFNILEELKNIIDDYNDDQNMKCFGFVTYSDKGIEVSHSALDRNELLKLLGGIEILKSRIVEKITD